MGGSLPSTAVTGAPHGANSRATDAYEAVVGALESESIAQPRTRVGAESGPGRAIAARYNRRVIGIIATTCKGRAHGLGRMKRKALLEIRLSKGEHMKLARTHHRVLLISAVVVLAVIVNACLTGKYTTSRDKTAKGAGIGAVAGAIIGAVVGEGEADEILAGAAIGAGIGAGIGSYMDAQEEKLARIPGTTVERVGDDTLLVRFDSDVLFTVDSAMLEGESQQTLQNVAVVLNDFPKTAVVVQGFTDSTGSNEHNQALSERRADSVRTFLAGQQVDPSRMASIGYGEEHPVASNDTSEGRRLNRRVTILIKGKAR